MVYTGETECTYALQHLRCHQRIPPHLLLHWIHTNYKGTWTLRSRRTPTDWTSLKQSDKATTNQEGTWLVQRLRVQLLVSRTFVHVAKNLYLTIKETLRQRTELVCIIHLCFILFYLILFEREGCWYYIAMSPRVGWNRKGLETMYDMCVWPAMFF